MFNILFPLLEAEDEVVLVIGLNSMRFLIFL